MIAKLKAPGSLPWIERNIELAATVVLAIAAILTAWAAFQSAKWSGLESLNYSRAAAARTESAKATTRAYAQTTIDVQSFVGWLTAYARDVETGAVTPNGGQYIPDPSTASGFIAMRFRDEFRIAFDAWIATNPTANPGAADTPFDMPEYRQAVRDEGLRLEAQAEALTKDALAANTQADDYVLLTVVFAMGLFFAGISYRLRDPTHELVALAIAVIVILIAGVVMATFPVRL